MITVFYDGGCGLCSKEIEYYRKIAPAETFIWKDANKAVQDLNQEGISLAQSLKLLHAKDNEGKFHIGVDAFILIWRQLDYWHILAKIISLPAIRQITNFIYKIFANWRFKKLNHCQIALKKETKA